MNKYKVTWEMVDYWLGDDSVRELLVEIANGEYTLEQFKQDIIDTWQEKNAIDVDYDIMNKEFANLGAYDE